MKLHATRPSGVNTITGYGEGYVMVNGERRSSSLVVLPDRIEQWPAKTFDQLVDDVLRRRPVRVAHRQVDDIVAAAPRRHLQLVGDVEDVRG